MARSLGRMKSAALAAALVVSSTLSAGTTRADANAGQPTTLVERGVSYLAEARQQRATQPRPFIFDATPQNPWLGKGLRLTLLARNRGCTSLLLGGDGRSSIDFAGVRRSTRMAVARVTLADGIVQPFLQLGAGAWRRDVDLHWRGDQWLGAQTGVGVQVQLSDRWSFALEADYGLWANPLPGIRGHLASMRSSFMGLLVLLP
jgi:hypothetical protein